MKFLFVATVLVFSIGSETAARLIVNETRATPLQLMLNFHFFYDTDFVSNAGANDVNAKKKIQDITYHTKNFFKLPSFPSEIMIKVGEMTRLGYKNVGRRTLSQKFQDFKNVLRNGKFFEITHLYILMTSDSEGRDNRTRMEVSEGSRVCSQLNEEKALIFEYWAESDRDTAKAFTQSIGHALYVQYDDNNRRDDQGKDCKRSLMARNDQGVDWSTCSSEDFTKKFTSRAGLPCLKSPEFTLKMHILFDQMFIDQYGYGKMDDLLQKAKKAFKLNTLTPKINLEFVGYTYLQRSYDINAEPQLKASGNQDFRAFRDFIQTDARFKASTDLFMLISAYPPEADTTAVVGYKEPKGKVCSPSKGRRAVVIKHNDYDDYTSAFIIRLIAGFLGIHIDRGGRYGPISTDKNGRKCDYGYMVLYPGLQDQDVDRWSQCSVDDIQKLRSGCGFCLQKSFYWLADGY